VVARWCGEDGARLFIARMRRFGGRYLCSPVLRQGRGGQPESRLPVTGWLAQSNGTARAAMGWLGQRSGGGGYLQSAGGGSAGRGAVAAGPR
jgi:hypothetical protein